MPRKVETVIVAGEPVPESALTRTVVGAPSLVTLKQYTVGPTMPVRIVRACGQWVEGDEPVVHAEYGRGLIANGLANKIYSASEI